MSARESDSSTFDPAIAELGFLPCTPGQARWWFLNQLNPADSSPNIAVLWELEGNLRSAALEQAFRVVIQRHEILRTRLRDIDGVPVQEVQDSVSFNLSVVDLSMLPEPTRQGRIRTICEYDSRLSFDLTAPPLLRATLMTANERRALLLIVVHHAVFDGWSIGILARELGEICRALNEKRPHELAPLALQYGDYALWQQEYVARGGIDADRRYWERQLTDLPYFEIPPDRPRGTQRSSAGGSVFQQLDASLADAIERAAKEYGVSFFAFGAAIVAAMLRGWSKQSEIVIGTQVAGRDNVDLEKLIGSFVNNLVLRFEADGDQSFSRFVEHVAETLRQAIVHQSMPFDQLVHLLSRTRDFSRTPLYSINLMLQRAFMEDSEYGSFTMRSAPSVSAGALFDLSFYMVKRPGGWRMTLDYNADLYEKATAQKLLARWHATMQLAISNSSAKLSDFGEVLDDRYSPPAVDTSALPDETNLDRRRGIQIGSTANRADQARHVADIEAKLIEIWRGVLQTNAIERNSDFFALGGHSLSAMRVISRSSSTFGVKIDPMAFFQGPTISEFSRHIATLGSCEAPGPIETETKAQVSHVPLIALNAPFYHQLASRLGNDHPFINVQLFDPNVPTKMTAQRLEEIAADYVKLVKAARPSGPYALVGYCAIGAIAYEVAQQLRRSGEDVQAVVMFDSWAPGYSRGLPWARRTIMKLRYRLHDHSRRLARVRRGESGLLEYFYSVRFMRRLCKALLGKRLTDMLAQEDIESVWFLDHILHARASYVPKPFEGDVILFKSDDCPKGRLFDAHLGWGGLVKGRLQSYHVGGSHLAACVGPRAAVVAGHIESFLGTPGETEQRNG